MSPSIIIAVIALLTVSGFFLGRSRAVSSASGNPRRLHSLPRHYGYHVAIWCGLPSLAVLVVWLGMEPKIIEAMVLSGLPTQAAGLDPAQLNLLMNDIRNLAFGIIISQQPDPSIIAAAKHYSSLQSTFAVALAMVVLSVAIAGLAYGRQLISPQMKARNKVETVIKITLIISSMVAIVTTVGIILSLIFESIRFFRIVGLSEFLFGLEWSPQIALRADQVASSGKFGAVPLFSGTLLISFIAMCVATPFGLMSAIYMSEYAHPRVRSVVKPALEILAGVPTVVYGFFAALTVAPALHRMGLVIGLDVSSESALAAGVVMGVMIIPFVSSISDDVISAVPQSLREGSLGLGATRSETIRKVIIPAALPGIVGGLLLAVSRAIGETMIVVMAAGMAANLTANPFAAVTTVTVQIVSLLVGDQEFDSAKTLAAFALGLTLFCITLVLNVIALSIVNKYREQYE